MNKQPISISEQAAVEVRRLQSDAGKPDSLLRVGVQGGGCSGLKYVMRLEDNAGPRDRVVEDPTGIKIVVDPKSFLFLSGIVLDFKGGLSYGFQFTNPNAKRTCGCGESFSA